MHHDSELGRLLGPLSTKWIENAANVSRDTVAAWRRGRKPRADQWERFRVAFDAWRAGLADTEKAPPPEWAAAMEQRLRLELERNRTLIEALAPADIREAAARVIERLEALPPLDDAAHDESGAEASPDAAVPPGRGPGSHRGRVDE